MGFLSSIQKYHSADERPNENNTAEFGTPARTLFTELDPGDLHQKTEVTGWTACAGNARI